MSDAKTEKIRAALAQLDPANADHWTDDGLPKTAVVQRIAADQTIKRQDIQVAFPNFERPTLDPLTGAPMSPAAPIAAPIVVTADRDLAQGDGPLMTEDEVRAELDGRVVAAQDSVAQAQALIKQGNADLIEAQRSVQSAVKDRDSAFPPLTAAENIKQHIASENALREARVGGNRAASQLDLAMRRGNSRGWRRPTRSVVGAPTATGAINR